MNKEKVLHLQCEIVDILKRLSISNKEKKPKNYAQTGSKLFAKFYEFGLNCKDLPLKEVLNSETQIEESYNQITKLVVINADWIKKFIVRFPHIFLSEVYSTTKACLLRSGIETLFHYWGESTYEGTELKKILDPLDRGILLIDRFFKERLDPYERVIEKSTDILDSHWLYRSQNERSVVDSATDYQSSSEKFKCQPISKTFNNQSTSEPLKHQSVVAKIKKLQET